MLCDAGVLHAAIGVRVIGQSFANINTVKQARGDAIIPVLPHNSAIIAPRNPTVGANVDGSLRLRRVPPMRLRTESQGVMVNMNLPTGAGFIRKPFAPIYRTIESNKSDIDLVGILRINSDRQVEIRLILFAVRVLISPLFRLRQFRPSDAAVG